MLVEIHNDGPVTLVLERERQTVEGERRVAVEVDDGFPVLFDLSDLPDPGLGLSPPPRSCSRCSASRSRSGHRTSPRCRLPGEAPVAYAERLARDKALAVPGDLVLGADTTVLLDGELLEKPADAEDAVRMLRRLQGRTHEVITSVALVLGGQVAAGHRRHPGHLSACDDDFLRAYVATGEPMDKAGAYGIQGYGAALVERIEGDFFGVMGLPVRLVLQLMEEAGAVRFGLRRGM